MQQACTNVPGVNEIFTFFCQARRNLIKAGGCVVAVAAGRPANWGQELPPSPRNVTAWGPQVSTLWVLPHRSFSYWFFLVQKVAPEVFRLAQRPDLATCQAANVWPFVRCLQHHSDTLHEEIPLAWPASAGGVIQNGAFGPIRVPLSAPYSACSPIPGNCPMTASADRAAVCTQALSKARYSVGPGQVYLAILVIRPGEPRVRP